MILAISLQNTPYLVVHVSLILSEIESSALVSMNVTTINSTQMQSAITTVAAMNASVTCTDLDE